MSNGSMKVKLSDTQSGKFISAETHKFLFRHCADSHDMVSPGRFEKEVKPLLLAHGIVEIRFING